MRSRWLAWTAFVLPHQSSAVRAPRPEAGCQGRVFHLAYCSSLNIRLCSTLREASGAHPTLAERSFAIRDRVFARPYRSELPYYTIRNGMNAIMSPQKIRFRKTFPKDLPTIHKRYARTIALALDEIVSATKSKSS